MRAPPVPHRRPLLARLSGGPALKSLPQEIAANLGAVLSSRKGYGSVVPELGLGEFYSRHSSRGATEILQEELLRNITALEPRLEQAQINLLGEDPDFWLHFTVNGVAAGEPVKLIVSFQTTLGAVKVRLA